MITKNDVRSYYRFEVGPELFAEENGIVEGPCYVTLDDAEQALRTMQSRGIDAHEFAAWNEELEWNYGMECALHFCSKKAMKKLDFNATWDDSKKSEAAFLLELKNVYRAVEDAVDGHECDGTCKDFLDYQRILEDIEAFKDGRIDAIDPKTWSPVEIRTSILSKTDADLEAASEEERAMYRNTIDALCEKGDCCAMAAKAYCLYGGNAAYSCDWTASRDLLLALMSREDVLDTTKANYANTLGYIYYYGRCTDGVPDYPKALRYFSLGLANGYYESAYKLADMYAAGKGVDKNELAAYNLVSWVFNKNIEAFLNEIPGTKIADAALRLGSMYRDNALGEHRYGYKQDRDNLAKAYKLFMLAELALNMRAGTEWSFGDEKVMASVQEALRGMREQFPDAQPCTYAEQPAPEAINALFDAEGDVEVTIKRTKKGLTLCAQRLTSPAAFYALPEYGYCKILHKVKQKARKVSSVWLKAHKKDLHVGESFTFIADAMYIYPPYGKKNVNMVEFRYNGDPVALIGAKKYLLRVDWKGRSAGEILI